MAGCANSRPCLEQMNNNRQMCFSGCLANVRSSQPPPVLIGEWKNLFTAGGGSFDLEQPCCHTIAEDVAVPWPWRSFPASSGRAECHRTVQSCPGRLGCDSLDDPVSPTGFRDPRDHGVHGTCSRMKHDPHHPNKAMNGVNVLAPFFLGGGESPKWEGIPIIFAIAHV
jgi:hypothetical protein